MDDLLDEFVAETRDMLELLSGQLVRWEQSPEDRALLDSVFRFVHTVKGSCGFLDLPRLERLSHAAEDLLSGARDNRVNASAGLVTAVLKVIDRIAALTNALDTGKSVYDDDDQLIADMLSYLPASADEEKSATSHQIGSPDLLILDNEVGFDPSFDRPQSRSVRVSLALLDKLMNGVSDLVLARNEVSRHIRSAAEDPELDQAFVRLSSSVADMRNNVGQMRMQNIDRLFSSLPRVVRDIAYELGKQIDLQIEGSEVEIDRDMVEALRDPLLHILRNSADHGIESSEIRRSVGKDPVGCIRILACQSGNQIVIEISDDGKGIDVDKLRARALMAKLVTQAEWSQLSSKAQLAMIFMPGFSTAEEVTAISGRGVGMDVVRTNIEAVGGTIDIDNNPGQGLKMTLKLPLTLSIIAGLSVKAGDQLFGIPRSAVIEILSNKNAHVKLEAVGGCAIATIRGKAMPYARLETLLDIPNDSECKDANRTMVVLKPVIGECYVLDVASVIDHEELVVKPGAPLIMASGLYAGTSLPDNGRPVLLLDISGIATAIGIDTLNRQLPGRNTLDESVEATAEKAVQALLFNTIDMRKCAIRLSAVDKIEDISVHDVRFVGGKMRIQKQSDLYDVFGLDSLQTSDVITVLRVTDSRNIAYLAIDSALDIFGISGTIIPSANSLAHEGVINAFGEPVELLNICQFFDELHTDFRPASKALCYVECEGDGHWERHVLQPLLLASGYKVSFDPGMEDDAAIVLSRSKENESQALDQPTPYNNKLLKLRSNMRKESCETDSIYCYDRFGLIAAIESKLAEAG